MSLQDDVVLFSKPRHKKLTLSFDAVSGSCHAATYEQELLNNEWKAYVLDEKYTGMYTEVDITLMYYQPSYPQMTISHNINIDDIAIYKPDMAYTEGTKLNKYGDVYAYMAISENRDIVYLYNHYTASNNKFTLYDLNVIASVDEITYTNENIVTESLSITESLCASDYELHCGRCEAKSLSIRIVKEETTQLKNRRFNLTLTADTPDHYLVDDNGNRLVDSDGNYIIGYTKGVKTEFNLGTYRVFSDKPTMDRQTRELLCYDRMYYINNMDVKSWYSSLTFPLKVKAFRDSFFSYIGVTQVSATLINDDFYVRGHYDDTAEILGQTIIESICELNGVFGRITTDGKFEYYDITNTETVEYPFYVDGTGTYEDYVTDFVTGINVIGENGEIDVPSSAGTDGNVYLVQDNPIVYGAEGSSGLATAMENLLDKIGGISYRPYTVTAFGTPTLPVGTKVVLNTKNKQINSLIMTKNLTGIQNMRDSIEAYGDKKLQNS